MSRVGSDRSESRYHTCLSVFAAGPNQFSRTRRWHGRLQVVLSQFIFFHLRLIPSRCACLTLQYSCLTVYAHVPNNHLNSSICNETRFFFHPLRSGAEAKCTGLRTIRAETTLQDNSYFMLGSAILSEAWHRLTSWSIRGRTAAANAA